MSARGTFDIAGNLAAVASCLRRLEAEVRLRQAYPYRPESGEEAAEVLRHLETELALALSHIARMKPASAAPMTA